MMRKRIFSVKKEKGTCCVMRFYQGDLQKLKKTGVATVAEDDRILHMEEKPAQPQSNWCIPPFYYYTKQVVPLIAEGISQGCGTDAPGAFIAWLCDQTTVHAMEMPGSRYDIGDLASYEAVQKEYKGIC